MRYKTWRSRTDAELHVICMEGSEAFEALPSRIRNLGPWSGGKEGETKDLRLPYRLLIAEQGFVIVHCHISKLTLEARGGSPIVENRSCPYCNGSGHVPSFETHRSPAKSRVCCIHLRYLNNVQTNNQRTRAPTYYPIYAAM
jgi:hypothetical protein